MPENIEHQIALAMGNMRKLWAILMITITIAIAYTLPVWYLLFMIPISFILYHGCFAVMVLYLMFQLKDELTGETFKVAAIRQDVKDGTLKPGSDEFFSRMQEAGLTDIAKIDEFSPNLVGIFNGQNMYEWVQITNPALKLTEKFFYHSPAHYDEDGAPILPDDVRLLRYAHVGGVIYAKEPDEVAELAN